MATPNGDVKSVETAESFARDYLDDLFNNNKNLGAFEEETLDLNITSKYDNIVVEEVEEVEKVPAVETAPESIPEPAEGIATFSSEPVPVPVAQSEPDADEPLEPGQQTFQVNGHAEEEQAAEVPVAEQNGHHDEARSEVIEPGQVEFTTTSTESVLTEEPSTQASIQVDEPIEPGHSNFESAASAAPVTVEEEEEAGDVVAPIPMSRAAPKTAQPITEEEEAEIAFKHLGLSKNWWDSKRAETETTKEAKQPVDKFKTIKQNIRKGNTRSLLERFENMSKVFE